MSIQEIPLDSEEIIQEKENENLEETEEIQEKDETKEIQEKDEAATGMANEAVEAPAKKPRGRPKGSTKPKPPPPEKPERPEKPKTVAKAKPQKKKVVHYQSESSEEELPQYVRSQLPQRDLATQMFQLLQNHENQRAQRKRQMYNSWFSHF
jgi:hypothetical protein